MRHHLKGQMASRRVWLDGRELKPGPSQKLWNHSPDGFNWGYHGSGPAQLALAICLKLTRDKTVSLRLYQEFKRRVLAALIQADFDVCFEWDLSRAWLWRILPVGALEEGSKDPAIEAQPENPAPQERSNSRRDPPPWCVPGVPYCDEPDCTQCPRG